MTDGRLASLIGIAVTVAVVNPLGHILFWCEQHGLPPLTVIVVSIETGKPGEGLPRWLSPSQASRTRLP